MNLHLCERKANVGLYVPLVFFWLGRVDVTFSRELVGQVPA